MDRSVAEAIRQQSDDLRDELKELEQWEDAMQAREMAKTQRKVPWPTSAAAAEPPIRGTVPSLKEAIRQQQQQARAAGASGDAAAEAMADPIQRAKDKGNALFQSGHLQEAVAAYTVGIDLDPASATTHVLYANRAMCYLKLGQWTAAEKDATTCVHMNTGYAKAYYRRAVARKQLGKLREARADLEAVLALAPKDVSAQQEMESVTKALQAKRAAASQATTTTAATTKKKRIVIEEVDSEGDEAAAEAPAMSASQLPTEEDLHQACIEEDMRRLAAARKANEEQVRQESQREAAAQAKRQRRHERVEIIEEEEHSPTEEKKTAPSPATSAPAVEQTPPLPTSSPPASSSPSSTSAATRPRARPPIAKESLTTPKSFSEFERRFRELVQQPELRDHYVRLLDPTTMAKLFGSNMSPEMLLGILQAIKTFNATTALQYAKGLCQVSRVEDVALFFDAQEKAVVQDVLDLLRSAPGTPAKDIQQIERKLKPL
ncbi:Tetratricopeptide (TRP) repeat protein [Leishmania donovani]|uniref:RNA polymerase II-associated protein 3 n=1 Tax=Leishmania donovani TaxID=5661 RepID=A0A3Q8IHU4_LEIDO|nr:TPR-repeat protein, putative [Leishmania donovani]TPP45948.1 TPR repeat family protein [Leishmania donovani]CAJ1990124.1 Tetratricopeptide (TRP) repeat protein [Leishmania donovani]VDZ45981.1 TPR-repeat_protein_putative/GeneDB:LmjF.27.2390 [Leishmania donovani]